MLLEKFLFYFIECGHCSNCFILLFFVYWLLRLCCFYSLQSRQKAIADLHQMQNVHVSFYFSYWLLFLTSYWTTNSRKLLKFRTLLYPFLVFQWYLMFGCWWVKKNRITRTSWFSNFHMHLIILFTLSVGPN